MRTAISSAMRLTCSKDLVFETTEAASTFEEDAFKLPP